MMSPALRKRKWRRLNKIRDAYLNCKCNAKSRFILWEIDELQWWVFCLATNYHLLKGKASDALSLDRIVEDAPYTFDNIQAIPVGANVSKRRQYEKEQRIKRMQKQPDDPF